MLDAVLATRGVYKPRHQQVGDDRKLFGTCGQEGA
jgi:hypothetical protein